MGNTAAERQRQRRARLRGTPLTVPCWFCNLHFATDHARATHQGITHEKRDA